MEKEVKEFLKSLYMFSDTSPAFYSNFSVAKYTDVWNNIPIDAKDLVDLIKAKQCKTLEEVVKLPDVFNLYVYRIENQDTFGELPEILINIGMKYPDLKLKLKDLYIQRRKENIEKDF